MNCCFKKVNFKRKKVLKYLFFYFCIFVMEQIYSKNILICRVHYEKINNLLQVSTHKENNIFRHGYSSNFVIFINILP